jgi:hypothetical protein
MRQEDEPMGEVGDRNVHGVETDVSSGGDKNVDDVRVVEDIITVSENASIMPSEDDRGTMHILHTYSDGCHCEYR